MRYRKALVVGVVVLSLVGLSGVWTSAFAGGWHGAHVGVFVRPGFFVAPPIYVRPYYPAAVVVDPYYPPPVVAYGPAPVYAPPPPASAVGTVEVTVAPLQAAVYLDGRYLGRPEDFRDGLMALSVSPGTHTVELQYGEVTHTHTIQVHAGARVAVNDRLQ